MIWQKYYKELEFKIYLPRSHIEIVFTAIAIVFNIIIYSLFWENVNSSFFIFSFISIIFPILLVRTLLLSFPLKIFYNKSSNQTLEFQQKKYLKEYLRDKNNRYEDKVFFITWFGQKKEEKDIERAIYFYSKYRSLIFLRKFERHRYIARYIFYVFLFTSIAFWGLISLLTTLTTIYTSNENYLFLLSILYNIYIIWVAYLPYIEREQRLFFIDYLQGFPQKYFLLDSNLDIDTKEEEKSFDVLAIVFGVLFTLYVTLSYEIIYTVGVDIKKISVESTNLNESDKGR